MSAEKKSKQQEVYLVNWKHEREDIEIFNSLVVFAESYPRYDLELLQEALAFGKTVFENEEVRIEKKAVVSSPKPDFLRPFFWDCNYDKIDWQQVYVFVMQRILERGNEQDWQELIRYYGIDKITHALKHEITYLPDERIKEASVYFKLNMEDLLCYIRKQSMPKHWR